MCGSPKLFWQRQQEPWQKAAPSDAANHHVHQGVPLRHISKALRRAPAARRQRVPAGLIDDPLFWFAAVPAVLAYGISKGGFAGGFGIVSVPLMALAISPIRAAAILLPILLVMDVGAVLAYRRSWDRALMKVLMPAALAGIAIGTLMFRQLSADAIKLLLGAMSIGFVLYRTLRGRSPAAPATPSVAKGVFWAAVSGFTSFIAHAGGPPLSVYLLPLRMAPTLLVGTVAVLFAVINWAKVLPYWWLGLFSMQNFLTAAALAPIGLAWCFMGPGMHWLGYVLSIAGAVLWTGVEVANLNFVLEFSGSEKGDGEARGGGSSYEDLEVGMMIRHPL